MNHGAIDIRMHTKLIIFKLKELSEQDEGGQIESFEKKLKQYLSIQQYNKIAKILSQTPTNLNTPNIQKIKSAKVTKVCVL